MKRKGLFIALGLSGVCLAIGLGVGLGVDWDKSDSGAIDEEVSQEPWKEDFRLPSYIKPTHYDIELFPDPVADISYGSETITVDVEKRTRNIVLHAIADLTTINPDTIVVEQEGSSPVVTSSFYYDENREQFFVIQLEHELEIREAHIYLEWQGPLVSTLVGINKVNYKDTSDAANPDRYIIATKFEPTYAREAYPCFDEPAMKAVFDLSMYHEEGYHALWNMPQTKVECDCDGCNQSYKKCKTEFERSPVMGTYQPTFIWHNMCHVEGEGVRADNTTIPIRVFAACDKLDQVGHSLKVQQHVTTYFEELYKLPYALPKVDLIAIPDFVTGAMEQWGLITYRETSLLYDSVANATSPRQSKSSTISHEYVHQWFGNLVTCKWWDNIWIQEGPATFWSQEGIEEAYENDPWDMEKQQIYNSITYSLNRDVSVTGRPIVSPARNPDEITAAFDWVIYDKAASIIYTLREAMGKVSFDNATTQFLTDFQFKAADELDFINAYQEQATKDNIKIGETPLDVKALMHPFLKQALYPLLTAKIEENEIVITQGDRPFLHNAESTLPEAEYNFKYSLVVTSNQDDRAWFSSTASEIRFPKPTTGNIFKLNYGQKGYYRVKYEGALNDELILNINKLDEMDRMGVVDDAFNLAISGDITYSDALDTVEYIAKGGEDSYYVWGVFGSRTSYMRTQLAGTSAGDKFIAYFKNAVSQQFDRFGLEVDKNDSHIDKKMRSNIVSLSVSFGVEKATEQASAIYKAWKDSDGLESMRPHPDVAGTVYNLGVSSGTYGDWEFMYAQYIKELVADEKKKYMRAMAATENVTTIDYMLNTLAMDKTIILEQDFFTFINYISYTTVGERMTWDWVRVHWMQLVERFGTNDRNFGRLAPNIANDFKTEYGLWSAADFFQVTEADAGAGEGPRKSTLAQIESNIDWLENYESDILDWLEAHV